MAHKKGVGSTDNGRDSNSKRLGVKLFGGEAVINGNIIVRQRGTKYHPGNNVGLGKDFTIYSLTDGTVRFHRGRKNRVFVSVDPLVDPFADFKVPAKKSGKKSKPAPAAVEKVAKEVEEQLDKVVEAPAPVAKAPVTPAPVAETPAPEEAKKELFGKIGQGSAENKDDLKKVKGIGPKLEEVLNDMGIYSFEQVSKMGDREYDLVDSMLSSFKGRGKRDQWHVQAKELLG